LKIAVAGIVKNEIDILLEWIAYHRVVGISHFYIADNESNDGTRELLSALSRAGLVTTFDFPSHGEQKPQLPAYSRILRSCSPDIDVLAFIDADEFLLPTQEEASIVPLINRLFADESVSAVALNWAIFGSAGYLFAEDGLVIERFTKRARQDFPVNNHYKSIVRPGRVKSFVNPHHVRLNSGRYTDVQGNDLVQHSRHPLGGLSAGVIWENARINHYAVRSLEEFVVGKSQKGSACTNGRIKHKAYFLSHDKNDEVCLLASALAPKVHEELKRLEALVRRELPDVPADASASAPIGRWFRSRIQSVCYTPPRFVVRRVPSARIKSKIYNWHVDYPADRQLFEDDSQFRLSGWMLPIAAGGGIYRIYVRSARAVEYFEFNRQRDDVARKFHEQATVFPGPDGLHGFTHALPRSLAIAGFEMGFEAKGEQIPVIRVNVRTIFSREMMITRIKEGLRARLARFTG